MSDDRLDRLDYYTLLSVDPKAGADAIRAAFHDFARRYHPDRFADAPPAKRERAAQIFRRGAEGYRVLMDPQRRSIYEQGLAEGRLRLMPEREQGSRRPASSGRRVEVSSPRARPFLTKALAAYAAGDYKSAKLNFKLALSYEPGNALLEARLAEVEQRLQSR